MSWLIYIALFFAGIHWFSWRYKNRRLIKMAEKLPGPFALPVLGNAWSFICKPEEFITMIKDMMQDYGDTLRFWLGPDLNIIVQNPDDIKILLSSNKTNVKGPMYKYMADIIGGGIMSGSGPVWRKHRKIVSPNYGKSAVDNYNETFNKEIDFLLETLRCIPEGENIDILKPFINCTSYIVCQTLMGLTREQTLKLPRLHEIIDKTPRIYDLVFSRMRKWYMQIDQIYWLTSFYTEQKYFITVMSDFSQKIIQHGEEKLKTNNIINKDHIINVKEDDLCNTELSVIDRLILSQELNYKELLEETFTIFITSQETSGKISAFLLLMMAYHPKCQEKLVAEIKSVIGNEDRWVTEEDLKSMPYLDMVFKETIRLFPIGPIIQRTIQEDITISSGTLPAGSSLLILIYHMQRDPRFWNNPDDFDPERFSPENVKLIHPNSYIPFSWGPMDCIGRYFGTKLIKMICVRVLQQFKIISLESFKDLKLAISISITSLDGFKVNLQPRRTDFIP